MFFCIGKHGKLKNKNKNKTNQQKQKNKNKKTKKKHHFLVKKRLSMNKKHVIIVSSRNRLKSTQNGNFLEQFYEKRKNGKRNDKEIRRIFFCMSSHLILTISFTINNFSRCKLKDSLFTSIQNSKSLMKRGILNTSISGLIPKRHRPSYLLILQMKKNTQTEWPSWLHSSLLLLIKPSDDFQKGSF